MTVTSAIADWGIRSQLMVSPNPSLNRMPSRYIESPIGLPASGDPRNPRYVRSFCHGLPWLPLMLTAPRFW